MNSSEIKHESAPRLAHKYLATLFIIVPNWKLLKGLSDGQNGAYPYNRILFGNKKRMNYQYMLCNMNGTQKYHHKLENPGAG